MRSNSSTTRQSLWKTQISLPCSEEQQKIMVIILPLSAVMNRLLILRLTTCQTVLLHLFQARVLVRAMQCNDPKRRLMILGTADVQTSPAWNRLQADTLFEEKRYAEAVKHYLLVPQSRVVYEKLEVCYREMGDYKLAYEYACKQR